MMQTITRAVSMFPLLALLAGCTAGRQLYVAPDGDDAWSGAAATRAGASSTNGPFATLERARDAARALRAAGGAAQGPLTIHVQPGVYALPRPLALGPRDSGAPGRPVVWRGAGGGRTVLLGGKAVTGFVPTGTNGILVANVGAQGFSNVYFRQLLFDGRRQPLARYPNFNAANPYGGGWAYADGKPVPMGAEVPGEDKRTLVVKPADLHAWARPAEGEVFVFPRYNWWNNIVRIASVDATQRIVRLAGDCSYPIRPTDRYYVRNLFEELDAPGEWWLDRASRRLYFKPPAPLEGRAVYAPRLRTILELGPGTAQVVFRDFTFECAEGTAISLKDATNCLIAASVIRNAGDYGGCGVAVSGGTGNGVAGCDIYDIGSHGILLSGGDRATLTPAGNFAENNYIHHVGVFYKQGVGVHVAGVGNRVARNLIHDTPRMGIQFSGNNHLIELNHLRHVNLETSDTGAIYTGGRDWVGPRGTVIRYNYFHDILGFGQETGKWVSPHYAWGVYLDDNSGGVDVIGNIVVRSVRGLIHLHNGRDNRIENNIFVGGTLQQMECNGWTPAHRMWKDHLPTMIKGYEAVANEPAWRGMRNMGTHPTNAVLPDGTIMSGNVFLRNIVCWTNATALYAKMNKFSFAHNVCDLNLVWHGGQPILTVPAKTGRNAATNTPVTDGWASWQALGPDRHSVVADPLFVNAAADDYRLRPGSPAFALGFEAIPVEKIGPYASELRASWPIVEAEGAREKPLVSEAP